MNLNFLKRIWNWLRRLFGAQNIAADVGDMAKYRKAVEDAGFDYACHMDVRHLGMCSREEHDLFDAWLMSPCEYVLPLATNSVSAKPETAKKTTAKAVKAPAKKTTAKAVKTPVKKVTAKAVKESVKKGKTVKKPAPKPSPKKLAASSKKS